MTRPAEGQIRVLGCSGSIAQGCRKAHRTHHAQGVFQEAFIGVAHRADYFVLEIFLAVIRIDDFDGDFAFFFCIA